MSCSQSQRKKLYRDTVIKRVYWRSFYVGDKLYIEFWKKEDKSDAIKHRVRVVRDEIVKAVVENLTGLTRFILERKQ